MDRPPWLRSHDDSPDIEYGCARYPGSRSRYPARSSLETPLAPQTCRWWERTWQGREWKTTKSPDIGIVPNVRQIDVADPVLHVDCDVLPVPASGALELDIGQPSTWTGWKSNDQLFLWRNRVRLDKGLPWPCSDTALMNVLPPESLWTHRA